GSEASLKAVEEQHPLVERAQLQICAAPSCPAEIREECVRRAGLLEARLATITFTTSAPDAGAIVIAVDGLPDPGAGWGRPIVVEPRPHVFTFTRAGEVIATR